MTVSRWSGDLERPHDVIVVGSGAPALTAALAAAVEGASVLVLEKSAFFGGTSAISGGMIWVPLNHHMSTAGMSDSRADVLRYLSQLTNGRTAYETVEAVVDSGPEMLEFIEREGGVRFALLENFPDYHAEWPGGRAGGRSLEPQPLAREQLGDLAPSVRPLAEPPITIREHEDWRTSRADLGAGAIQRSDAFARGQALIAPLLSALAARGATLVTEAAASRLIMEDEMVGGVVVGDREFRGSTVVLACGGFEWNEAMTRSFLPGPVQTACSPPHNTGDGIRMAAKIGAKLGNMNEAFWQPQIRLPDKEIDGVPIGYRLTFERSGPRTVIVNRAGRRFVNEAFPYNDMGKAFHHFDPDTQSYHNLPAYLIFDHAHFAQYGFLGHDVNDERPPWITRAESLAELAARLGIDARGLQQTLDAFNAAAREGRDPDFHRGDYAYDRYWGDRGAKYPALGPVETAPFYAVEVTCGTLGTKGGMVTNEDGQVLDAFDDLIPGLYAAGNTTAHPMGPGYPGAGGTLGPAMAIAYRAGLHASRRLVRMRAGTA